MPCTRTCKLVHPFHPWGSCVDSATGKIDKKLKHNTDLATDVYLSRVDGSLCGETTIRLFKGAESSERQKIDHISFSTSKVATFRGKPYKRAAISLHLLWTQYQVWGEASMRQ